ncbi:CapA family protein, partial [Staphylococcus aureus]|uniref:CapA family protein n=1 Tax=Staphylococcus aureus TaxID=1280 RepID=UPI003C701416
MSTASAHSFDKGYGPIGLELDQWGQQKDVVVAGTNRSKQEQEDVRYFTIKGVKFAFMAYATNSNESVAPD